MNEQKMLKLIITSSEKIQSKDVVLLYLSIDDKVADFLTKAVGEMRAS